jgi:hypothetical protein
MENDQPLSAADLCSLIANQLEGMTLRASAYGAGPNDAVLVGGEHTTTVLSTQGDEPRWFKIAIQEFHPDTDDPLWLDYEVLRALARRAGVPAPTFRLGPATPGEERA